METSSYTAQASGRTSLRQRHQHSHCRSGGCSYTRLALRLHPQRPLRHSPRAFNPPAPAKTKLRPAIGAGRCFSGPITIPHLYTGARTHTFFHHQPESLFSWPVISSSIVPTLLEQAGDFSASSTPAAPPTALAIQRSQNPTTTTGCGATRAPDVLLSRSPSTKPPPSILWPRSCLLAFYSTPNIAQRARQAKTGYQIVTDKRSSSNNGLVKVDPKPGRRCKLSVLFLRALPRPLIPQPRLPRSATKVLLGRAQQRGQRSQKPGCSRRTW